MNDNKFISEVLQQVAESKGDAEQVHSFLKAKLGNLEDLDETFVKNFPSIIQRRLKDRSPEEQKFIAQTLLNFSTYISKFPLGNRTLNLELAKVSCSEALEIFRHNKSLVNQAKAQNNLGNIYSNRVRGDRANNIEKAIECHNNALNVFNSNTLPEQWATATCALGNAYFQRIEKNRAENIEQAIKYYQTVLNVRADTISAKLRATTQNLLGNAYVDRLHKSRADNIEEAINKYYKAALDVYKPTTFPEQWAATKHNLGHSYYARIRGKRAENLKRAIKYYEDALTVRKKDAFPMDWATTCNGLGDAYARIQEKRAENLERAIKYYKDALTVRKKDTFPMDWATTCNNLANVYRARIEGKRIDNLEKAIKGYKDALTVRTQENLPVDWAQTKNNLSIAYYNRIQGDRAANLEEAIEGYKDALTVRTQENLPVDWATTRHNLATAYYARIKDDRAINLGEAIEGYKNALTVRKKEDFPVEWAQTQNNLANVYFDHLKGEHARNLEEYDLNLITLENANDLPSEGKDLVIVAKIDSLHHVRIFNAAGKKILDHGNNEFSPDAILVQAIDTALNRDSIDNQTKINLIRKITSSLRHIQLEKAIEGYKNSLTIRTRKAFPVDWAQTKNNLANTYSEHIKGDKNDNLQRAVENYKDTLEVYTRTDFPIDWANTQFNLASTYARCIDTTFLLFWWKCCCKIQNELALKSTALDLWSSSITVYDFIARVAINASQQALEVFQPKLLPNECRLTARLLGNLYSDQQCWNDANTAYGKAIEAAEVLYQSALSRSSQEAELVETNDLFRRAAFAEAKMEGEEQLTNAVTTIEQGRARGLRETLERDRIDLSGLEKDNREIYEQYQKAAAAVRQLEIDERALSSSIQERKQSISETELRQHAETVRQGLSNAIDAIRQCYGYENFLKQPSFDDIAAAVQPGQPLVYLLATPKGGLALIVHQGQSEKEGTRAVNISQIWLDKLTDTSLRELLVGSDEEPGGWFGSYPPFGDRVAWLQTIDQVTHQLWTMVMEPVVTHLESLQVNKAVLVPTGYLSFLPIHAAWTEEDATPNGRRYALDSINFTYAPNASALQAARAIRESTAANSLLAINEPQPTSAIALPASEREVEVAIDYFQGNHNLLKHKKATRKAVLAELPKYDVLHFSCHGYANIGSPLDSGLVMANDQILSLRDFFKSNLQGVRLAILSACETGLPGAELPDEVVSLPTGLLQAGVAGVMASLWSVSDFSTMMLLVRFYDGWQKKNLEPIQALRNAQQWVRDTSNAEKVAYIKSFIPEFDSSRISNTTASKLYQKLAFQKADDRAFEHPYYWAAFTYVGV